MSVFRKSASAPCARTVILPSICRLEKAGRPVAKPKLAVVCVTGESSIQMCLQELSTCKQYRLPIKIINLNNKYMGMVRQWQQFFHGNRHAESYMDSLPNFEKLERDAKALGLSFSSREEMVKDQQVRNIVQRDLSMKKTGFTPVFFI